MSSAPASTAREVTSRGMMVLLLGPSAMAPSPSAVAAHSPSRPPASVAGCIGLSSAGSSANFGVLFTDSPSERLPRISNHLPRTGYKK